VTTNTLFYLDTECTVESFRNFPPSFVGRSVTCSSSRSVGIELLATTGRGCSVEKQLQAAISSTSSNSELAKQLLLESSSSPDCSQLATISSSCSVGKATITSSTK
jgi:hypothetical protein